MKASIMTRLERLEKDSPVTDESKRIDRIVLRAMRAPTECVGEYVFWTRPGFVEAVNES